MTLRDLRHKAGLTQRQVSEKINVTYQAYAHYENNRRVMPLDVFLKLKNIFDVDYEELIAAISQKVR